MNDRRIRPQCIGEKCTLCGQQAEFKVAEEFQLDEPQERHPLTAYVCSGHFAQIMSVPLFDEAPITERNT